MTRRFLITCLFVLPLNAQIVLEKNEVSILGLRVNFAIDDDLSSTGDGSFLLIPELDQCGAYTIDPPPHNRAYFQEHLKAVDNYYRTVSKGNFGIDLKNSQILPVESSSSYQLDGTIASYYPYNDVPAQELGIARFFKETVEVAYAEDKPNFENFDLVVIFHAGIGQDFALPFIDPTQTDIPSMYIDSQFLQNQLSSPVITLSNGSVVSSGIILPETQNHLLYDVSSEIFSGVTHPCDYQFGLTGTFALLLGTAIGLPPLWNKDTGESGVGVFALMDQGSNNGRGIIPSPPDPWTRVWARWEKTRSVNTEGIVSLFARDSLKDEIVKVIISSDEYFLIENRSNWVRMGVDIDSMRFSNADLNRTRGYIEVLLDSSGVSRDDETGVIVASPNYDLGLPGSGILIWHVDEKNITKGLGNHAINIDREQRGIDLEEADGAQDIGYQSSFLFTDPSNGLWSDMWFDGNGQFAIANPAFVNRPPSFGPDTYPDTRANSGAQTFLQFNDISPAGRTMSFSISNLIMANGFPDSSLKMELIYDFTGDGKNELVGVSDSLWWSSSDLSSQKGIFPNFNDEYLLAVTNIERMPEIAFISHLEDQVSIILFSYSPGIETFEKVWSYQYVGDQPSRIIGYPTESKIGLDYGSRIVFVTQDSTWEKLTEKSLYATWEIPSSDVSFGSVIHTIGEGLKVSLMDGTTYTGFEGIDFQSLVVAELDGDAGIEIIVSDDNGAIYAMNENLTILSGFPVEAESLGPIMVGQLTGSTNPEIVTKTSSGDIYVLDWTGSTLFNLASNAKDVIRMVSSIDGKNVILTSSSLLLFDEKHSEDSSAWPTEHGDVMNRRIFKVSTDSMPAIEESLIISGKTYCYPNPVENGSAVFRIMVGTADNIVIKVYDLAGFFVKRINLSPVRKNEVNEIIWDVSSMQSGIYFASVEASSGGKSDSKILKIAVIN